MLYPFTFISILLNNVDKSYHYIVMIRLQNLSTIFEKEDIKAG